MGYREADIILICSCLVSGEVLQKWTRSQFDQRLSSWLQINTCACGVCSCMHFGFFLPGESLWYISLSDRHAQHFDRGIDY